MIVIVPAWPSATVVFTQQERLEKRGCVIRMMRSQYATSVAYGIARKEKRDVQSSRMAILCTSALARARLSGDRTVGVGRTNPAWQKTGGAARVVRRVAGRTGLCATSLRTSASKPAHGPKSCPFSRHSGQILTPPMHAAHTAWPHPRNRAWTSSPYVS